jgi:hypothetical protein
MKSDSKSCFDKGLEQLSMINAKVSLSSKRIPNFLSPSILIGIILLSFSLKITNEVRWLVGLSIFSLIILIKKPTSFSKLLVGRTLALYLFALCLFQILKWKISYSLQFLSFGYDNAFHFTLFRGMVDTSWNPALDQENWFTDFQIFTKVPLGYHQIVSFVSTPFLLWNNSAEASLAWFATFQILSSLLFVFLSYKLILGRMKLNKQTKIRAMFFSLAITSGLSATLLVNGFPPYLMAVNVSLIWLLCDFDEKSLQRSITTLVMATYALSMITPLSFFITTMPLIFLIGKLFLKNLVDKNFVQFYSVMLLSILMAAVTLQGFTSSSSGLGWRQLLQFGGVQPVNKITFIGITFALVYFAFTKKRKISNDIFLLMCISTLLSVTILSALTYFLTGNIQYYAIKQIYLFMIVAGVYVGKELVVKKFSAYAGVLFTALVIMANISPSFYTGGYMGVLPNAISHTLDRSNWTYEGVNADLILETKREIQNPNTCIIWRIERSFYQLDLSSRWMNSLKKTDLVSEDCFSAYWNNQDLTTTELIAKLKDKKGDYLLILEAGETGPSVARNVRILRR